MKYKIFVDGQEGTTGLKINERLSTRDDIEILKIDTDKKKDISERKKFINEADIVFLCLPDTASKESVTLVENQKTKIIDASTAHRTNPEWVYGLPELNKNQRNLIKNSKRVAVPGCHATGFVIIVYPLIQSKILEKDYPFFCTSLTGYSGGGKKMIEEYETNRTTKDKYCVPRPYSLKLNHKHLPEMQKITGINFPPIFNPIVSDFYNGMAVSIPIIKRIMKKKMSSKDLQIFYKEYYENEFFIKVIDYPIDDYLDNGFFPVDYRKNTNFLDIVVCGNEEDSLIIARFDNLGKGASGAAIQNMNIMLGVEETKGLI